MSQYMLAPDHNVCGMSNPIWGDYLCGGPYTDRIYGRNRHLQFLPQQEQNAMKQNKHEKKEGFSPWIRGTNMSSYGLVQPGLGFRRWEGRYDPPEMQSWDNTMRQMQMHYARFR